MQIKPILQLKGGCNVFFTVSKTQHYGNVCASMSRKNDFVSHTMSLTIAMHIFICNKWNVYAIQLEAAQFFKNVLTNTLINTSNYRFVFVHSTTQTGALVCLVIIVLIVCQQPHALQLRQKTTTETLNCRRSSLSTSDSLNNYIPSHQRRIWGKQCVRFVGTASAEK